MSIIRWLSNRRGLSPRPASRKKTPAARATFRPTLEALEDRWVPSTLTVLNNRDSGAGSLRAAIAASHTGDKIVFDPSLNGQTITLTSGELPIKRNLIIAGPGAGSLTVSGNFVSRVFAVEHTARVTLSGLTISNGAAGSGGGGIRNGGTLTVTGCILSSNSAPSGGGIFNFGTLTVSGSTLSGNSASERGGGIYNTSTAATVTGSTLSGNSAVAGGAIFNGIGTLTIDASTLSGNVAAAKGGGIVSGGTVTVKNFSSIAGNTAPLGFGADVYNGSVVYLDGTSTIGVLDGNPALSI
jgi:hypothetical protein